MINFEELRIKDNEVLAREQWNGLLDNTQRFFEGNVGLGTDSPQAKLHVEGSGGMNIDLLVKGRLKSDDADGGLWISNDRFVGGKAPNKIGFYNNNAWRLCVLDNGHVGIGTETPVTMLHVNGSVTCGDLKAGVAEFTRTKTILGEMVTLSCQSVMANGNIQANRADVGSIQTQTINARSLRNIGDKRNMQYNEATGEIGWDSSTRNDKWDIAPLRDDFGKVMQLQPRKYTRSFDPDTWEIGYIAEEAEALGLDHLIFHDENNNPDGINYRKLCLYLVEIVREHERRLNPDSLHLKKYESVPEPDLKSTEGEIRKYMDYHNIQYNERDTKEILLKKIGRA
jgi:hypothetical protein